MDRLIELDRQSQAIHPYHHPQDTAQGNGCELLTNHSNQRV